MASETTVHVVDDELSARESAIALVCAIGYSAEGHESAEAFLDAYDPTVPGCVILDVRLGGMNGLSLQEEMARWEMSVPIIMVSGHADEHVAARALEGGAIAFLEKPIAHAELIGHIRKAIELDASRRPDGSSTCRDLQ